MLSKWLVEIYEHCQKPILQLFIQKKKKKKIEKHKKCTYFLSYVADNGARTFFLGPQGICQFSIQSKLRETA